MFSYIALAEVNYSNRAVLFYLFVFGFAALCLPWISTSWKRRKNSQDVNAEITQSNILTWAWVRACGEDEEEHSSQPGCSCFYSTYKFEKRHWQERQGELFPYYFPTYTRVGAGNDTIIYYVTSRTQNLNPNQTPQAQIRRKQHAYHSERKGEWLCHVVLL